MDIKTLHDLASLQVKSVPNVVPKIFLDKIRKNLNSMLWTGRTNRMSMRTSHYCDC